MDPVERQEMEVDIACVGFGPAMGGFLTTLGRALAEHAAEPGFGSTALPGLPLQVACYERADDLGFGVSGVATRARAIRTTFPDFDPAQIPMAHPVSHEELVYLLDPHGASRRSRILRSLDGLLRAARIGEARSRHGVRLPYVPPFLRKDDGLVLSIGQFNQWVGSQVMAAGQVQIWPASPVAGPRIENGSVTGIRMVDQGVEPSGEPGPGYLPGMEVRARLTVVGDGAVGAVGMGLDEELGMPEGHERDDWAVGMKVVVELPERSDLRPGTVVHTLGYPEPGIFGFLYVHPGRLASLGIFVPSWLESPVRTSYRYLQHWMTHPYLWRWLEGGTLRSWGARTLQESGRRGEPHLVGDGYARIGEGSGSTNILTGSGVDEAWATGVQLAEGVSELLLAGKPLDRENLEATYIRRRRESWVESEGRAAEGCRDGFRRGFLRGLLGLGLAGLTDGRLRPRSGRPGRMPSLEAYYRDTIPPSEIDAIRAECERRGSSIHDALMDRAGWPSIPQDGRLLVSHQDALLLGGKVQAPPGYADHVVFRDPSLCERCETRLCIEICSGQALTPGGNGVPAFDREKCVHCGACIWNCTASSGARGNVVLRAGAGGLHSAEN